MEARFWYERWNLNEIAFHENQTNLLLLKHFSKLALSSGSRIFVPLCGKTKDMIWFLSQGFRVVGVELSPMAVDQFLKENDIEAKVSNEGKLTHYSASNLDIYVGDIFDLNNETLGQVDAIYDRAALVALPLEMRVNYAQLLLGLTGKAQQLLICFDYDQNKMAGPPFSVSDDEIYLHYGDSYEITLAESLDVVGGLKGICPAKENAWLLQNKGN